MKRIICKIFGHKTKTNETYIRSTGTQVLNSECIRCGHVIEERHQ
jgi:hypothetical protein